MRRTFTIKVDGSVEAIEQFDYYLQGLCSGALLTGMKAISISVKKIEKGGK